ncbi:MAG: ribonuclease III, partial [Steroidobacteraceae bacterium]
MDPAAAWLAERLGVELSDAGLLGRALTHRSHGASNNERLEYLGDAVLNFVVAEMLYRAFPEATEGELSRFRASLVSGEALAAMAADLGIGQRLLLGEGEMKSGGQRRATILADALEAVLGAVYVSAGMNEAHDLVMRLLGSRVAEAHAGGPGGQDYKSRLQELSARHFD